MSDLSEQFGSIDIYVFDQLLRGNISPGMKVLDAGCGSGRNLTYLLREGYCCFGVDRSEEAIGFVRAQAARLALERGQGQGLGRGLPAENFRVEAVEAMSFPDGLADVVICNSVLHFAKDDAQFGAMVRGLWRVLRPGGMLFCRLASTIGGGSFERVKGTERRYLMSHGAEWFLVDEELLMGWTAELGGELVDPLKTTVVQGTRCMTTWVVRKGR
jgi:2-polyprenyl-3-methyl-5-hydroxy-6-metoxy-1,4-benzoquinol methylase